MIEGVSLPALLRVLAQAQDDTPWTHLALATPRRRDAARTHTRTDARGARLSRLHRGGPDRAPRRLALCTSRHRPREDVRGGPSAHQLAVSGPEASSEGSIALPGTSENCVDRRSRARVPGPLSLRFGKPGHFGTILQDTHACLKSDQ